jgi:adenosylcobyric acid synthase
MSTFAEGLGLLPLETRLGLVKTLRQTSGRVVAAGPGFWSCLRGQPVRGYEIHLGTTPSVALPALLQLEERADGVVLDNVAGTYVHGLFELSEPRQALLDALAVRRGFVRQASAPLEDPFDRLADVLEARLDLTLLPSLAVLV